MKFIDIYQDLSVKLILSYLSYYYFKRDFKEVNRVLCQQVINNGFLTIDIKKKILRSYIINLKLKRFIDKYFYKKRLNKLKSVNNTNINLEEFINVNEKIELIINNNKFTFDLNELSKIFVNSLSKFEDIFPDPEMPTNPYTNEPFSLYHIEYIYKKLYESEINNNRKIPLIITIFKNCSFDINILKDNFGDYLINLACKNHVLSLEDKEYIELFEDFLLDYDLKKTTCMDCIKEIPNFRDVFNNLLITYHLENNFFTIRKPKCIKIFYKIKKYYNMGKSCLKHRKYYIRNSNKPFNFNVRSEPLPQPPINFVFRANQLS